MLEHFTEYRKMLKISSITHIYSVKLFLKLGRALLIGPARNCHISSPVRLIIHKLFWVLDESFKIASCAAPRHISMVFAFDGWPFFLLNHFQTVLIRALLRDMCNVRRAPRLLLNLPLRLAAVGCTLQWTSEAEINKQLQLLYAKTIPLNYVTVVFLKLPVTIIVAGKLPVTYR